MINAEHAEKIIKLYESDYDNFLKGLKKKAASKKLDADMASKTAANAQKEASSADQTAKQAEKHKKTHLKEQALKIVDQAGGLQGAAKTVANVINYFKPSAPGDYNVSMGETKDADADPDKKKPGVPTEIWYVVGVVGLLAVIYGLSRIAKPAQEQLAANYPNYQPLRP